MTRWGSDRDREAVAVARQEILDGLHRQLTDGILKLHDPAAWQAWLQFAHRFHRYSFNNTVLLLAQDPAATAVAGYRAFQAMGRQVRRGEKALRVLAPVTKRVQQLDPAGQPVRDPEGRPVYRSQVVGFRAVPVFDIRQTDGPPLPAAPEVARPTLLTGQAPEGLLADLTRFVTEQGYTVERGDCGGERNGYTDFAHHLVVVRDDVDDAQAVKTLCHEAAHVLLHGDQRDVEHRGVREVEAESVAYLVTAAHGLDSSQYSFTYVTSWATDMLGPTLSLGDVLQATGQRVITAADRILQATQPGDGPIERALHALDADVRRLTAEPATVERAGDVAIGCDAASPAPVSRAWPVGPTP